VRQDEMPNLTLAKIANLKSALAELKMQLAVRAGYDPNQPRWPPGTEIGGQWKPTGGVTRVAGKWNEANRIKCEFQRERDEELCRMSRSALCWDLSTSRYAACMKDDFVPPLRH
jgi:hypothetical protein